MSSSRTHQLGPAGLPTGTPGRLLVGGAGGGPCIFLLSALICPADRHKRLITGLSSSSSPVVTPPSVWFQHPHLSFFYYYSLCIWGYMLLIIKHFRSVEASGENTVN